MTLDLYILGIFPKEQPRDPCSLPGEPGNPSPVVPLGPKSLILGMSFDLLPASIHLIGAASEDDS